MSYNRARQIKQCIASISMVSQNLNTKAFCPRGVAVDGYRSIFVCDYNNDAIHVISQTGNAVRVIQQSEGCPIEPLAIGFKKNGEEFAVTKSWSSWRQVTFFGF